MFRLAIIVGAVLFSILYGPSLDPRIVAALKSAANSGDARLSDSPEEEFYCPMDADVRAPVVGFCPRCGMRLIRGLRDATPYVLNLDVRPSAAGDPELKHILLEVRNPRTGKPVRDFEIVHEKLYHLFVVSQDLTFFLHTHPERRGDEDFHVDVRFPRPGAYRILSDFYPKDGGPQLIKSTLTLPGVVPSAPTAPLQVDLAPKTTENARVGLEISPPRIVAGQKASLRFQITPATGLEPYLGTMAHLLAVSEDTVDMIHTHPSQSLDVPSDDREYLFFGNLIFARPGIYRMWIQFQRLGAVNTAVFDIQARATK